MIVRNGVEVLLCVEGTPQEKSQVAIGDLDDICDLVDDLTPIKCTLVRESVFNDVGECDV